MKTMARPSRPDKEYVQVGWRLDGVDRVLLDKINQYAKEHRLSRNSAITIAVERLIKEWESRKSN